MSRQGADILIAVKRRVLASLHMAIVLAVLYFIVTFVMPVALDPRRALDSFSANYGAILFRSGALGVLSVLPIWGVVVAVLTLVGAFDGKRECEQSADDARSSRPDSLLGP